MFTTSWLSTTKRTLFTIISSTRALSLEMQNQAAEVKLLVERKIGSLLADMTLRGGDHKSKLGSRERRTPGRGLGILTMMPSSLGSGCRHANVRRLPNTFSTVVNACCCSALRRKRQQAPDFRSFQTAWLDGT